MKERDKLYKIYVKTKDANVWENYRVVRNRVKRLLRDSRNRYFHETFQPTKASKDLWSVVRSQGIGKKQCELQDPVVPLNDLNDFFCGINNAIDCNIIEYYKNKRGIFSNIENCFNFVDVTTDNIHKMLMEISSNAVGNDSVHIKFLRVIFDEVKDVLCHIYNFSLVHSVYPSQWKKSLVLPLPKVKNPQECKNYRSINILCVLGKVLDKLVYNQVKIFIENNNILYKYQSGYRTGYSTQTALVKITDDIRQAIDKRQLTLLMLLDFSRAFDCVNHSLLLSILESYNLSLSVVKWFRSYLLNREQRVKTQTGNLSDWQVNTVGVPQGSTLSALLFSIYINKINDPVMFCRSMLYADDMQLYVHCNVNDVNAAVDSLNIDVNELHKWCIGHGLQLNIAKCKPMLFGSSRMLNTLDFNNINNIMINGEIIEFEPEIVNLGLRMSRDLSWRSQVDYIHRRVFQCIYQLQRLCFHPPEHVKKLLIKSLVMPLFDYSNVAYCDLNNELVNKLQKAQNACIRFIFNLKLYDHVTPYYHQLGILKIKERIEYNVHSLVSKVLKTEKPTYLFENYIRMDNVHLRPTRFSNVTIQMPIHRTVIYNRSFLVTSIRLLNSLERQIRESDSNKIFLEKVKKKLLERYL